MNHLILLQVLIIVLVSYGSQAKPSFTVDYEHDTFLKDGKPFQYVSGTIHYFRIPHQYWKDRLQKLRALGANAVQTYIEWSFHEPEPGKYSFEGDTDIVGFIKEAQAVGLNVIIRPGPFIDAERDHGGLPYWLHRLHPDMKIRTTDPSFIKEVEKWFSVVIPKLRPLLYSNGGPIITMQVENEYGAYGCDKVYLAQVRDMMKKYLNNDEVVFFTTDTCGDWVKCGSVEGALATVDFHPGTNVRDAFGTLRKFQPKGPLVNSEYYIGWFDHWELPHHTFNPSSTKTLDEMLAMNASVNLYVFNGGTNYGFTAGAKGGDDSYRPVSTSYDWDAPISEAGDPTPLYFELQSVIKKYLPIPPLPKPTPSPKGNYGHVDSSCYHGDIFEFIDHYSPEASHSENPQTFESLSHPFGFVLYSTKVPIHPNDPSVLKIPGLADRAHVFVNRKFKGILSREMRTFELPITDVYEGDELQILVENQGRFSFGGGIAKDFKGIVGQPSLDNMPLKNWTHRKVPLDGETVSKLASRGCQLVPESQKYSFIPSFFGASIKINATETLDTFLRFNNWRKGHVFVNGFNIGRYWPVVGPQETLYVPKYRLKPSNQENEIVIFELEFSPIVNDESRGHTTIQFVDKHNVNSSTPYRK